MTYLQLLLSIGIPSFLVVLSWFNNNSRFDRIDKRFKAIDGRLDAHDKRFDEVLAAAHKDSFEIMRSMTALHERVAVVEARQNSKYSSIYAAKLLINS